MTKMAKSTNKKLHTKVGDRVIVVSGRDKGKQGNVKEAISLYEKAARMEDNYVTTPFALFKAGFAYQTEGNYAKAAELYREIKQNYPQSTEYRNIDKYISFAEQSAK